MTATHDTQRRTTSRGKRRKKQKRPKYRMIVIPLLITFGLGFFLGLLVGSQKADTVQFVMPATAAESQTTETPQPITADLPWYLTLVNFEHPLEEDFVPTELAEIDNGYEADSRIADAAKQMLADAYEENVRIIALSAYRDYEYQMDLFENKVQRLQKEKGYSVSKAREEAATVVAYPGTSEHQLGLALDLVDARHTALDESQENTAAYQWLCEHCDEYGFIVRYPNGKTDITGIIYEPWHFRYVGKEAAKVIMENDLTLEEYLTDYYSIFITTHVKQKNQ